MNSKFKYIESVIGNVTNRGEFIEANNWEVDYYDLTDKFIDTYHSAFMHSDELLKYTDKTGGKTGYEGEVGGRCLFWDIDNADIGKSYVQTKQLVDKLCAYNPDNIRIYFSGCKGFHVIFLSNELNHFDNIPNHHMLIKNVCSYMAYNLDCFDSHIYDRTRIIRSPNTINSKTGLYKIELSLQDILDYNINDIVMMAKDKKRVPFTPNNNQSDTLFHLIENIYKNTISMKQKEKKISTTTLIEGIKHGFNEGDRNNGLTSVAGLLHNRNIGSNIVHSILSAINTNSSEPLPDRDVWNIVNSVNKYRPDPLFVEPIGDDIITMEEAAKKWLELRKKTSKLNSGFKHIDNIIPFFDPGEVLFIAARSGVGKTTIGMQLSNGIAQGHSGYGLFASLEMPTTSIFVRSAIIESSKKKQTKMSYEEVTNELLKNPDQIKEITEKWNRLLIIDRASVNVEQLKSYYEIANEKYNFGISNFLIDYVGLISGASDYDGLSKAARSIKQIAKILNARIIVVVQLSRKAGDGTVPVTIDMLRDSGALEESADYIMGVWLSVKDPTIMHCSFIKNRFAESNQRFIIRNVGLHYTSEDYIEETF